MKRIALIVAALAISVGAFAQRGYWEWGVKGGLNVSNLSNVSGDDKMKASFYAGLFAEYRFSDYFGLQPEITYSRQGNFYNEDRYKLWNRVNYLNIPVIAKIYVTPRLSVDVGPQLGILLNNNTTFKWKNSDNSSTNDHSIDANGADFGIAMGLSARLAYNLDLTARYNLGLTDILKDNDGDAVRNGVIQVGLGYRF